MKKEVFMNFYDYFDGVKIIEYFEFSRVEENMRNLFDFSYLYFLKDNYINIISFNNF